MQFAEYTMATTTSFSVKSLVDSIKAMEWLRYEVAPEWDRFCSFGPEDIGSVWEKIGAIRKRPQYSMALISQEMAAKLNKQIKAELLNRSGGSYGSAKHDSVMFGLRVEVSPYLSGNSGYLVKYDSV